MKKVVFLFLMFASLLPAQQTEKKNFILLVVPEADTVYSYSSHYRLSGSTLPDAKLFLNDSSLHVFQTGAFGGLLNLNDGENDFTLVSLSANGEKVSKKFVVIKKVQHLVATSKDTLVIEDVLHKPTTDLMLNSGDVLSFRIKGTPGLKASFLDRFPMTELVKLKPDALPGVYVGKYKVKQSDSISVNKIFFTLTDSSGRKVKKYFNNSLKIVPALLPLTGVTIGERPYLNYGLGTNRLGGAKLEFIRPGIVLRIIGKNNGQYKVYLCKSKTAWIPKKYIKILDYDLPSTSLTGLMNAEGNDSLDIVSLNLNAKLPYSSHVEFNPTRIIVDVYGATSNTNWVVFKNTCREIKSVNYVQAADEDFRISIELKHEFPWGYSVDYSGNQLNVYVKHKPKSLDLEDLVIALDAGHGGRNRGAVGSTGILEKQITFSVISHLKNLLEDEGAKVMLTRTKDTLIYNSERLRNVLKSDADILISVHANSIGLTTNPLKTKGTSTYYKHIQYAPLAKAIFYRMLQLGLKPYGYVGKFNFTLNSPTELPNVLVETAFLSNPEDEMKLLDDNFREKIAEKILEGLQDFLDWAEDR